MESVRNTPNENENFELIEAVWGKELDEVLIKQNLVEPIFKYESALDCLEDDCLFHIYSYLSMDDIINLLRVNQYQKPVFIKFIKNMVSVLFDIEVSMDRKIACVEYLTKLDSDLKHGSYSGHREIEMSPVMLDCLNNECLFHIYSYLSLDEILRLAKVSLRQRNVYLTYKESMSPVKLDYLNEYCLLHLYSYLSLVDLRNLSKVSNRQETIYRAFHKTKIRFNDKDFVNCLLDLKRKLSDAFNSLSYGIMENNFNTNSSFLNLKRSCDFDLELPINRKTIKLSLFNFAYLTVYDFYRIEHSCPNLETLELYSNMQFILKELEYAEDGLFNISNKLQLKNPYFISVNVQEDIKLMLVDMDKKFQNLKILGKIESLQNLDRTLKCLLEIWVLTNNIENAWYGRDFNYQQIDLPHTPKVATGFKYLADSDLGKMLKVLEIDFDFFNIIEDDMEYFTKFVNLKELKMYCSPFILESAEFFAALKQLAEYNLKILEINFNWLDRSDDSRKYVENLIYKIEKIKLNNMKNKIDMQIRVMSQDSSRCEFSSFFLETNDKGEYIY